MVKKKTVKKKKATKSVAKKKVAATTKKASKKAQKSPKPKKTVKPVKKKVAKKAAKKAVTKKKPAKKAIKVAKKVKAVKTSKTVTKKKVVTKKATTSVRKSTRATKPVAKTTQRSTTATTKPTAVKVTTKKSYRKPLFPIRGRANNNSPEAIADSSSTITKAKLDKKFLAKQKQRLLELRDHILDQMQGVAQDSLRSKSGDASASAFGMHQADAGSDAYEKDFALSLLSQEQDALYEVEEAITRIETKTYGTCEMSGEVIPLPRLEAMPFARFTLSCQKIIEQQNRGRNRWDTAPQFMESTENFYEEDDDREEEVQKNLKG